MVDPAVVVDNVVDDVFLAENVVLENYVFVADDDEKKEDSNLIFEILYSADYVSLNSAPR